MCKKKESNRNRRVDACLSMLAPEEEYTGGGLSRRGEAGGKKKLFQLSDLNGSRLCRGGIVPGRGWGYIHTYIHRMNK